MNKFEKIKERVAYILEYDADKITPESRLREDLGMDSLDAYEIAYAIESEFDINTGDDMTRYKTCQDFIDLHFPEGV